VSEPTHLGGNFRVRIGDTELGFAHVGPLTVRGEVGRQIPDPVVLRRAVSTGAQLWQWHAGSSRGERSRRDVVVELCDDAFQRVVARWVLVGAHPVRWTGPTLDANDREVAMEEIELQYERLEWTPAKREG
jgi:phage tail-like protein